MRTVWLLVALAVAATAVPVKAADPPSLQRKVLGDDHLLVWAPPVDRGHHAIALKGYDVFGVKDGNVTLLKSLDRHTHATTVPDGYARYHVRADWGYAAPHPNALSGSPVCSIHFDPTTNDLQQNCTTVLAQQIRIMP